MVKLFSPLPEDSCMTGIFCNTGTCLSLSAKGSITQICFGSTTVDSGRCSSSLAVDGNNVNYRIKQHRNETLSHPHQNCIKLNCVHYSKMFGNRIKLPLCNMLEHLTAYQWEMLAEHAQNICYFVTMVKAKLGQTASKTNESFTL